MASTADSAADSPAASYLKQILAGASLAQPLAAFVTLGLADRLAPGPASVEALALACGLDAGALGRLLPVLLALGVVARAGAEPAGRRLPVDEPGAVPGGEPVRYQLTPAGRLLCRGAQGSLAEMAALAGAPWRAAWLDLDEAVRTGRSPFARRLGAPLYPYLARHDGEAAVFHAVQAAKAASLDLAPLVDAAGAKVVVDVGGGLGGVLAALLEARPALQGVLFDRPEVVPRAEAALGARGLLGRCRVEGGDFFEAVPGGGDLYLACFCAHNWDDAGADRLLRACAAAMPVGARLLLVEVMLPPDAAACAPPAAALLDLDMLVFSDGGRERTEDQYRALLSAAGLCPGACHPVGPPGSLAAALVADKPAPAPPAPDAGRKTASDRL